MPVHQRGIHISAENLERENQHGGKGRFKDNIFIERLWRTLKYERIYLRTYETGTELSKDLTDWFNWYNSGRKHTSLDKQTPNEAYYQGIEQLKMAA